LPEGLAPDVFDGHLAHQQREADKAVLKLIQDAGAAKRDPPAFDLVRRLRTPEALEAALKVRPYLAPYLVPYLAPYLAPI
jgi:hypothetical protein